MRTRFFSKATPHWFSPAGGRETETRLWSDEKVVQLPQAPDGSAPFWIYRPLMPRRARSLRTTATPASPSLPPTDGCLRVQTREAHAHTHMLLFATKSTILSVSTSMPPTPCSTLLLPASQQHPTPYITRVHPGCCAASVCQERVRNGQASWTE